MAARLTASRRGRWIAAAAGVACVAVVSWLGLRWRQLHVRYLLSRLDAAQSFEEARGLIQQVARHGSDAEAMRSFVEGLKPARQRALFWFLACLDWDAAEHRMPPPTRNHAHPCWFVPMATSFYDRAIHDEELLVDYSCHRWWRKGRAGWMDLDHRLGLLDGSFWLAGDEVRAALAAGERKTPGKLDAVPCVQQLDQLAVAWTVGMDVQPLLIELRARTASSGSLTSWDQELDQHVTQWLKQRWQRLAYDPATRRCKPLPDGAPDDPRPFSDRGYPVPEVPFRDWTGPMPAIPGKAR